MNNALSRTKTFLGSSTKNKLIALGVALVVVVIGYTLVVTRAAGLFASLDPAQATVSGNAQVVTDTTALSGKAIQFGTAQANGGGGGSTLNLPRIAWEGGPTYYSQFPAMKNAKWDDPNFFPIGVWYEAVTSQNDADLDKAAGLNTYIQLTDSTDMSIIRNNGLFAMPSEPLPGYGSETVGWLLDDEVDLWGHEGNAPWTGNEPGQGPICIPESALCGYTVLQTERNRLPQDGRPHYANFGFGIEFWIGDQASAKFLDYTELSSLDTYWYTDTGICDMAKTAQNLPSNQCARAASYGATVDRMHQLAAMNGKLQPIYGFVEDGSPFQQFNTKIQPDQLKGAVMNTLIHEARGVIYFNHNFGGSCISQHVLRDSCGTAIRPAVTAVNAQIKQLAPVLNTQSYKWTFNPQLDTMLKEQGDSYYIFAMPSRTGGQGTQTLTLPAGINATTAQVMFENRSVNISGGTITDSFPADYSYHIYKITK